MKPTTYNLSDDPVFYMTAAAFALLTTALPAALGQPRFLPISQTIALTAFMAVPLRRGRLRHAATLVTVWLAIQITTITLVTLLAAENVERAIPDGFAYRATLLNWMFVGGGLPMSVTSQPLHWLLETMGVIVGSLATAGLVGNWLLVRTVNLAGFTTGSVSLVIGDSALLPLAVPIWSLLRIAGLASLVILLAEPLLTSNWSLHYYLTERRKLMIVAASLLIVSAVFEMLLPPLWQSLITP